MKNIRSSILLLIIFISLAFSSCNSDNNTKTSTSSFVQVGYFKGENNLRYYTFWVKEPMKKEQLLEEVKLHGSQQRNTSGQVTASFYYTSENEAPDITNLDAQTANEVAHENKPAVAVWIMPNGQINIIENP